MTRIITAFAEAASGPGWGNQPIIVVTDNGGKYELEYIQPDEQTAEMMTLYQVSEAAHLAMTAAVRRRK